MVLDDQVVISVRKSKTDQLEMGQNVVLRKCSIEEICPVRAVRNYRGIGGRGDRTWKLHSYNIRIPLHSPSINFGL